jgi:hypothetical protein
LEFAFTFDDAGEQVTITLIGRPTPLDFRRLADELVADPRFRRNMLHLVDCSQLVVIEEEKVIFDEMEPLVERDWEFPPRAVAIVAPGPIFERAVLARAHLGGSLLNRRVFSDIEDAREWLSQHREA